MIKGIDISHWQGKVDWKKAYDNGVRFAICKVSQGDYYTDNSFPEHYHGAKEQGIAVGAYHWFMPGIDYRKQKDRILKSLGNLTLDIAMSFDCEDTNGKKNYEITPMLAKLCADFKGFQGFPYPKIYTRKSWWDPNVLRSDATLTRCGLWVANWGAVKPVLPVDWTTWDIWQYALEPSEAYGIDPRASKNVDCNYWNPDVPFPTQKPPAPPPEPPQPPAPAEIPLEIVFNGELYKGTVIKV